MKKSEVIAFYLVIIATLIVAVAISIFVKPAQSKNDSIISRELQAIAKRNQFESISVSN